MGAPPSASPNQGNTPGLQRPPSSQPQLVPQQFSMPMNQQRPQIGIPEQQQFGGNTAELALVKAKYQDHLNKKNAGLVQQAQQAQQAAPQQRPVSMSRPQLAQQMPPAAQPQTQKPAVQTPMQQMPAPTGVSPATQPPQQVKAPLAPGQQVPQINPNLVLSPEQVALMDTKEVPRQILGQLSNQIPLQYKTWGQVKTYLAQNNAPPLYLDALRTRQAQHFQLLARAQMMRRAQAQGSVGTPQPPQSQPPSQSQPQPQPQPQPTQTQPQTQPQTQSQKQQQQHQQAQQNQHQQQVPIPQPLQPPSVTNAPPTPVRPTVPMSSSRPNLQSLNPAQLQQLQVLAQQGKLNPQQNAHLQQQIFNIRQNQERQRAAAARAQQPPNPAPQAPAQQTPKQATVARPQQQSGSDSPSAPKKLKRERDGNEDIVVLDQRPASQMSNQQHLMNRPMPQQVTQQPQFVPPGQKPIPQQVLLQQAVKQQASQHIETQQSSQQVQEDANQAQQKAMIAWLLKMLEEERNSYEGRPPLQLPQKEKDDLRSQLSDANTKNMIRRTDQLLPMFVLLGGTSKATKELIRTVLLILFPCRSTY